ncbi:hypothetical protein, partial [Amycolatopsis regifaucium]|uniref:hypothetical protein n=1 Tax=Amycolatopsis regifaucium TaxID=546365 RepID=UPI0008F66BD1
AAGSLANLPKMDSAGLLAGLAGVNAAGPLVNLPKVDSVGLLANMPPVNTVELMMKFAGPIRTSHLFADLYAPSAIAKLNTEKLTRGLGPRNLAVGLRVAEALAGIDGNKILDEHAGHSASDLSVELAAPQNATAVVGALSDLTADVSDRSELEILDLLGARAAEALARFGDMFATTLRGITFRSSQRYIALALLAELQLIMFISDRNLFEYISDHFGFQANILAVWLFLRAGKRS